MIKLAIIGIAIPRHYDRFAVADDIHAFSYQLQTLTHIRLIGSENAIIYG
jgi:hypothetical protein